MSIEIIPMSLRKREKRPSSQLKTTRHKKRKIEDIGKRLKKTKRVHEKRAEWQELQNKGRMSDPKWK